MNNDRGIQYWQEQGQWQEQDRHGGTVSQGITVKETNMRIGDLSTSKFLKGSDVNTPLLGTIDSVTLENVARPGEPKRDRAIIHFKEDIKSMVSNKTNLSRIARIAGSEETDDWAGTKVVLFFDPSIEMGGQIVGGLRVRAPKGAAAAGGNVAAHAPKPSPQARKAAMDEIEGMDQDVPF